MGLVLAALAVKLLDESVVVAAARLCGAACAAVTCGTAIGEVETALAVSRTADVDSLCNTVDDAGVAATGGVLEPIR